jgi:hypothetical protein
MGHIAFEANKAHQTELLRRAHAARVAATALDRRERAAPKRARRAGLLQTLRPSRAA